MENKILNWTLKIIIHTSALLSVWRSKNKFWHIIFECIYGVVISVLPILFVSFLGMVIRGDDIFVLLFLIGIMLWLLFMAPRIYDSKENKIEKIKYIVSLIVFEFAFGVVVIMLLL